MYNFLNKKYFDCRNTCTKQAIYTVLKHIQEVLEKKTIT